MSPTARPGSAEIDRLQAWLMVDGLRILLVLILAVIARWLVHRLINRTVALMTSQAVRRGARSRAGRKLVEAAGVSLERHRQRTQTLGSLLRSMATFTIFAVAALTIMALLGLPLAPLLASAGVGGVALGFGAQTLVRDFLSGVFMILEDQYGVGDVVDVGDAVGTVEEVSLRVTRLRDAAGVTWYVRNGEIVRVGNMTQGQASAIVDIQVAYDQDLDAVSTVLGDVCADFAADPQWSDRLIGVPQVLGVEAISGQEVTIRVLAGAAPGEQWALQRELRARAKVAFDAAGFKAPPAPPYGGAQ